MRYDDNKPFTMVENLIFARNVIMGAISVTVAVGIPVWAAILTVKGARILFGL
jgi:hypothetical protein